MTISMTMTLNLIEVLNRSHTVENLVADHF